MAYASNESGRREVYVEGLTHPGRWQVSNDGGRMPKFARSGREIFYRSGQGLVAVPVAGGQPPRLGAGRLLFAAPPGIELVHYEPMADDQGFLTVRSLGSVRMVLVVDGASAVRAAERAAADPR